MARYQPYLCDGITILDVGSGRTPAIPVAQRPNNCRYLGLDIDADELAMALSGSYDDQYEQDLREHYRELDGQVDLAISWQVLEHIEPLADALANIRAYLKPGGQFVALLSGRNAHFALINRFVPERIGVFAMKRLLNRPPDTVFRAHYDSCTYSGLSALMGSWSEVKIIPLYRGAGYFSFLRPLARLYLVYEDWAAYSGKKDLATHYMITATK
jgi:SAM-dependent methyltransferase